MAARSFFRGRESRESREEKENRRAEEILEKTPVEEPVETVVEKPVEKLVEEPVAKPAGKPNNNKNDEMQKQIKILQDEVRQAKEKLAAAEEQVEHLYETLEDYRSKELQIAEVMINAQISAQRIETQARVEAELLQQQVDEELRRKNQELELMRMKVQHFRRDMNERLEQYKTSLDRIFEPGEEGAFTPTLVAVDKKNDQLG